MIISLPCGLALGGVTTWAMQLADGLASAGRRVRVVVHGAGHDRDRVDAFGVDARARFEIIDAPPIDDPAHWHDCLAIYRDLTPAILLPFTLADSYAIAAALATVAPDQIRVVGWIHSDNPYDYAVLAYYEPLIHRLAVASRHCAAELARRVPTRRDSIERFAYGVHLPPETSRPALAGRPLRLVYGGRMEHGGKRVLHFVDLAQELDRRGVRFELRLVGDGPQRAELERRIAGVFGLHQNKIRLEPAVPHERMAAVWSWADVALINSIREGFSLSMVESMSCGCVPVVSRVASGVGDIVQEGVNGLTFDVDDIAAMAEHVERLSQDEPALRSMSSAAREAVESCCGFDRYITRAIEIFDGVLDSAPRPWSPRKPLHMIAPEAGGDPTVPADAGERMRRLLSTIAEAGDAPVAIFGAGNHTRALASILADAPAKIVAIVDDDHSLLGKRLWGWPIVSPSAVAETCAKTVVISSWLHEGEIVRQHADGFAAAGLRVATLYAASSTHGCKVGRCAGSISTASVSERPRSHEPT